MSNLEIDDIIKNLKKVFFDWTDLEYKTIASYIKHKNVLTEINKTIDNKKSVSFNSELTKTLIFDSEGPLENKFLEKTDRSYIYHYKRKLYIPNIGDIVEYNDDKIKKYICIDNIFHEKTNISYLFKGYIIIFYNDVEYKKTDQYFEFKPTSTDIIYRILNI